MNPNDAVRDPRGATGPRTDAGKARASRNAIQTGLYAAHDFIRPGEEPEYADTLLNLIKELSPEGTLEETFTTEIMGATWRLRRCRVVEEDLAEISILDPMVDEQTEKQQKSVDRARAQAHNILRRCIAELRRLQTDRQIRDEMGCEDVSVLTDIGKVARAVKTAGAANGEPKKNQKESLDDLEAMLGLTDAQLGSKYGDPSSFCKPAEPAVPPASSFCEPVAPPAPAASSFCNPAPATPRNAQCPCGSGAKFKRCCGLNAPPVLNRAA